LEVPFKCEGAVKRSGIFVLTVFLFLTVPGIGWPDPAGEPALPIVRIGIVRDGPTIGRLAIPGEILIREIQELTRGEFDVRFPEEKRLDGNWTAEGVKRAVDLLLADPDVDLLLALSPLSSHEVAHRGTIPKPAIASIVIDVDFQDLPFQDGKSGVRNLNYLTSFQKFERDLKAFREILSFSRLAIILDRHFLEAFPKMRAEAERIARANRVEITFTSAETSADSVIEALPSDTEAVLVTPLPRFLPDAFEQLVAGINLRGLPSFSMFGRLEVERGILAGVAPASDPHRLARRLALNVQRILLGEDAGSLPVVFPQREQLTINMATARAVGFSPSWRVLTEAVLLNEERTEITRRLSLESAMKEAVAANLDLAASDRAVAAGKENIREARSALLPQIDVFSEGVIVDRDRAEASLGSQAERTFSGTATLTQQIYSEKTWANLNVQRHTQITREEEREQLRLDIARNSALAYLNVLRAKTSLRIQKDNLQLTRSNLELGRFRQAIGYSGPADVFRWESEIATDRIAVLDAIAQRKLAETALNRILHRPLEEEFVTEEASLNDPGLFISDTRLFSYIDNPRDYGIFRDFMVREGLNAAPELRRIDAAIAAQERTYLSAGRAFWSPDLALHGEITRIFSEGGAGSDTGTLGFLPGFVSQPDDTDWNVAVSLTFPLFTGGAKDAERVRAWEELSRQRLTRRSTAEKIEERIRSALHLTSASYPSITLSRNAAETARKNLELVTDSYSRGVVSIIELIDAQNAALVADQGAANAVYDFLIDLMNVQRAIGRFDFFASAKEREAWFKQLEAFLREAKTEGNKP
jgi:outer membrane protein TolC